MTDDRRQSIAVAGFAHENPIPVACRKGPFVFSGALTGRDPVTRAMPERLSDQVTNVFALIRAVMDAAGGSPDDVVKLTVWLVDYRDREALNREWLAMFPDAASRPARHVLHAELDAGSLVQAEVVAVLGPGV